VQIGKILLETSATAAPLLHCGTPIPPTSSAATSSRKHLQVATHVARFVADCNPRGIPPVFFSYKRIVRELCVHPAMIPKKLVLELAKGFRGRSKNCISIARERVEKALQYAYRLASCISICVGKYNTSICVGKYNTSVFILATEYRILLYFSLIFTSEIDVCAAGTCGRSGSSR
jgi:hypothetical protein